MYETVAFVLCIENNAIRDQALLLIESIRTFAGAHKDAEIIAISPRRNGVDSMTRRRLDDLDTRYVDLPLNQVCPEYGSANRIYGAAWAAQNSSASTLIVLDSDTIFFGEPELLGPELDVLARPVDVRHTTSTGPGDPNECYLASLCELAGTTVDVIPFTETTMDRCRVRAAYNGGYLVVRRESGILELAADVFTRSVSKGLRPRKGVESQVFASTGWVGRAASEYWGSNQVATSVAIWCMTQRVKELGRRYNVALHILAQQEALADEWIGVNPLHVHYHWMLNAESCPRTLELLTALGSSAEQIAWLAKRMLEARAAEISLSHAERDAKNAELQARTVDLCRDVGERKVIAQLTAKVRARDKKIAALKGSVSWLITAPLRRLGAASPALSRNLRRVGKLCWWLLSLRFIS
jgi:hypothetical protein